MATVSAVCVQFISLHWIRVCIRS